MKSVASLAVLVAVTVIVLIAWQAARPGRDSYRGTQPPAGITAPDFDLRNLRGGRVSMRSLRGRVVVLTFLDTRCREKCPIVASAIGGALKLIPASARGRVEAVAISVEPRIDTPARIRGFLRSRHASVIDYLSGSIGELRPVWKSYGIFSAVDSGSADVHSSDARVFDRRGTWVSTLHVGVDLTAANLVHDVLLADRS